MTHDALDAIGDPGAVPRLIERSAAPAQVEATLRRLVATHPEAAEPLADERVCATVVAVAAASRAFATMFERDPSVLSTLVELDRRTTRDDLTVDGLVTWSQRELLRIAARDLTGIDPLETTAGLLADLATDVLEGACLLAGTTHLSVIGMGKLGGHELNYSSDIDVMFVGDGPMDERNRAARQVMDIAGRCFRVDANLRPEGRNGPLVRSLDSYEVYWDRWAEPWERQALLKAVPVAGDADLGRRFHATAQRWVWSHPFDADDLRSIRAMKARTEQDVARKGMVDRELKRGPGGIRDIEFTVQLLQLVHGHVDPALRSPSTLPSLTELAAAGYVDPSDASTMADAYRWLRTIEHRVQLVDLHQEHALPSDERALDRLARTVGLRDNADATAAEHLVREVRRWQLAVRGIHERVYFRPLLEAFAGDASAGLSPEAAVDRLVAFGFTDAKRTQAAVRELTRGLNRSSRLMQQMLPLLLDWLSTSPDPELGLVQLRNLLTGAQRTAVLVETFRDSAEAARALCQLVGTSRLVGGILQHNPDLAARLPHPDRLATRPRDELVTSATTAVEWRSDTEQRQEALRRWKDRHLLGIAARDVLGHDAEVDTVGRDLTALAEASLEVALASLEPAVSFAVIAMGRFGGAELSYASDLDVIFVHGGVGADGAAEAQRVATKLLRFLAGATPAQRLYDVDADLRPEGKQGAMVRTLEGYQRYWNDHALTWERQAMLRARPVAGDRRLADRLLSALEPHVWDAPLTSNDVREIRRLKARIERERIPAGEDPAFHLKLGRGSLSDIEWTVQLLQLTHGVRATGTWPAMVALEQAGVLEPDDAEVLRDAYRFCERTRNRWYLVKSGPGDSLPSQPEPLRWLARSLGATPSALREDYRRVTRRARRITERLFYGQT